MLQSDEAPEWKITVASTICATTRCGGNKTLLLDCSWRMLAAGAAMLILAACATNKTDLTPQLARAVAPNEALIFAPIGGPAMLGIVETVYPNARRQEISLATEARTPGQNKITVVLFEGKSGDGSDAAIKDIPFTQVNLTEEALAAFPTSGMGVSPYFVQNDYGPFGYAVGKPANGDTCIYAWQRIEPALKPSGAIARGAVTVRLQLCDSRRSEQSLLGVMYQLRINVGVFPPARANPAIGLRPIEIRPVGAAGFVETVKSQPAPQVTRRAAPAVTAAPVAQAVPAAVITPPAGAPIVPLPSGMTVPSTTVPLPSAAVPCTSVIPNPDPSVVSCPTGSPSTVRVPLPPSAGN